MGGGTAEHRILHVEPDAFVRRAFSRLTPTHGFLTGSARTAAQARELAQQQPFVAIVANLELDDGNGLDLLRELSLLQPDATLVLTSSFFGDATGVLEQDREIHMVAKASLAGRLFEIIGSRRQGSRGP